MNNQQYTINTSAKINSQYYLNNSMQYSSIQAAWSDLLLYVQNISGTIAAQYGVDAQEIIIDENNKRVIIKRKKHNVPLDSYVPILAPVILDPLSANIKERK